MPTCTNRSDCEALYLRFCEEARASDPDLWAQWEQYREVPESLGPIARSNLIVAMAPHVSRFVARLFSVGAEAEALREATARLRRSVPLQDRLRPASGAAAAQGRRACRRHRRRSRLGGARWSAETSPPASIALELALARAGCALLDREEALRAGGSDAEKAEVAVEIDTLKRWCAAHVHDRRFAELGDLPVSRAARSRAPRARRSGRIPTLKEAIVGPDDKLRRREGFALTDHRYSMREVLSEIHYCVLCHERDKDTCTKGITDKEGKVTTNALGIPLAGCPLDEKISEMHAVRKRGDAIGALAIVTVDNPMCPGTGHRICNDCMKACIYQKQEPVNIPQIETGVLTDVLHLPWGVEIYGLLTRWNPLNIKRPVRAAVQRTERAGRRPRPGRLHAVALPAERRLWRHRHRRAQDRAAGGRPDRRIRSRASTDSQTGARSTVRSTTACSRASAVCPSTASRCAGTRTSSR